MLYVRLLKAFNSQIRFNTNRGSVFGREIDLFARRVRWVRQDGIRSGFLTAASYGLWELTAPGKNFLGNIKPGLVITIYETNLGVALWADATAASLKISGHLTPECLDYNK